MRHYIDLTDYYTQVKPIDKRIFNELLKMFSRQIVSGMPAS